MPSQSPGEVAISTNRKRLTAFLSAFKATARRDLRLTILFAAAAGALIIAQAFLVARILDGVIFRHQALDTFPFELTALGTAILLRAGAVWASDRFAFGAAARVMRLLRARLLRQIESIGPVGLADVKSGEVVAALAEGVRAVEPYFSRYLPASVQAALLPLAIFAVVLPLDWISALVFLVTAPLIPFFMILIGEGAERLNQRQWRKLARMSGHLLDAVQGLATLKAFNATTRMAAQVAGVADAYRRDTMAVLRVAFLSSLVLEFFATISIAIVAVLIGFRLLWGEMSYFDGLFILLLAPEFYLPLRAMGAAYHARMEASGAAERIVVLEDMAPMAAKGGTAAVPSPQAIEIAFDNVSLAFPDGRRALEGVSLTINPGETVALVGPSGAGKSSMLNLLLGFAHPTAGRILINGVPLESLDLTAWRRMLGYAAQRARLFSGTLATNIAPGIGAPDHGRLEDAARKADLWDVIDRLPEGLSSRIGEGGVGLSGGEAHRLALARAFYRDAPVIVLDEPTAHLDADSERRIQDVLRRLLPGRTGLMVAHRPLTMAQADRIVVLEAGRIAGNDRGADLIARDGLFDPLAKPGTGIHVGASP